METHQWAVQVTKEYLDSDGNVTHTSTECWLGEAVDERQARTRYQAITDTMANYANHKPTGQRFASAVVVRRPVGEWEAIA